MRSLTICAIIMLLFTGIFASGQRPFFAVETVRNGEDFSFPILNARRNHHVETKINQLLQLSELRGLADRKRRDVFEQAIIDDGSIYGRKVSLDFTLYANNPRILSVGINNSMDGATTHWWVSYYNFNSQNGDLISLRDLFTKSGYKKFVELVITRRSKAYRSEVVTKVKPDEREIFLGVLGSIESDELSDFAIGPRSITIDGENLLGKSFCCENLEMNVRVDRRVFKRWLNAYGRIVFGLQKGCLRNYRSNRLPQLFRGKMGEKFPFVAVLNVDGRGGVEGIYAYLKHRKGIFLTGTIEENAVQLTEHLLVETEMNIHTRSNHRFVDNGTISGTFDLSSLKGIWTGKEKERSMTFQAYR